MARESKDVKMARDAAILHLLRQIKELKDPDINQIAILAAAVRDLEWEWRG